jgi:hypothetical protein
MELFKRLQYSFQLADTYRVFDFLKAAAPFHLLIITGSWVCKVCITVIAIEVAARKANKSLPCSNIRALPLHRTEDLPYRSRYNIRS